MRYKLDLSFEPEDPDAFYDSVGVEEQRKNRADLKIARKGRSVHFRMEAQDATALKSAVNIATKIATVYEKTLNLENGHRR